METVPGPGETWEMAVAEPDPISESYSSLRPNELACHLSSCAQANGDVGIDVALTALVRWAPDPSGK